MLDADSQPKNDLADPFDNEYKYVGVDDVSHPCDVKLAAM
jgi:hypothetical protein